MDQLAQKTSNCSLNDRTAAPDPDWRKSEGAGAGGHQNRFEYVLKTGLWQDVTFNVGDQQRKIGASKLILSIGSRVFEALFKENSDKDSFDVPDLEPEEFEQLLKYLYTERAVLNASNCLRILNAALKYEVTDLVRRCAKVVDQTMTPASALTVFQLANKYGDVQLEEEALMCISKNANLIVASAAFLDLSVAELKKILVRDSLEVTSELELFDAVMKWGRAEIQRQRSPETPKYMRSVLEQLVPLIRFPVMDPSDFSIKVASSQVLLMEEMMSVLLYFNVKPELRGSMSTGVFNSKSRKYTGARNY